MKQGMMIGCLLALLLAGSWFAAPSAHAQDQQCFPETGKCVGGRFLEYWQQNGGLAVFGYPLTDQAEQDGRQVQYFERQRFELHSENAAPYDVLLGRLGAAQLQQQGIDWTTQPTSPGGAAGCFYFPETQHNVCNQAGGVGFLNYWVTHGLEFDGDASKNYRESLALFGYPITEPYQYTDSAGGSYQVQWFERARFEWHPENSQPYNVLLGRLGAETLPGATTPPHAPVPPGAVSNAAAVQTIVNYYTAINQQKYEQAYRVWADNGAASGQTLEQFTQGLAGTVQSDVQIGDIGQADTTTIPVTIRSVVNVGNAQQVQVFSGTYTVRQADSRVTPTGYVIASASIAEVNNPQLPPAERSMPQQLLQAYYGAINQRQFAHAYTLWGNNGAASGQGFAQFQQGFFGTQSVAIDLGQPRSEGAAGSVFATVPIVVVSTQEGQTQQTFCGTYTLRRLNVPPFDQLGWHIEQANVELTANVQPGSPEATALLTGSCPNK